MGDVLFFKRIALAGERQRSYNRFSLLVEQVPQICFATATSRAGMPRTALSSAAISLSCMPTQHVRRAVRSLCCELPRSSNRSNGACSMRKYQQQQ